MKIELEQIRMLVNKAEKEAISSENDNLDKMFNCGVRMMYYRVLNKLLDAEMLVRGSEK